MSEITDPDEIFKLFVNASKDKFWGEISFGFQDGVMIMVKKKSTSRVKIDFSTMRDLE
jgi:hypothetical protein